MSVHYEKPIDYDDVVWPFAERYRRMFLINPVFETRNTKFIIVLYCKFASLLRSLVIFDAKRMAFSL